MRTILNLAAVALPVAAAAQTVRSDDTLPGYYEFFYKTGQQRDAAIARGELKAVRVGKPLPALALPGIDGKPVDLGKLRGDSNLVIVGYRSWW